jgi:uncharacterized protein
MKINRRGSGPAKVQDRRGQGRGGGLPGGMAGAGAGLGGLGAIIAILIALFSGGGGGGGGGFPGVGVDAGATSNQANSPVDPYNESETEAQRREDTEAIFANIEEFWSQLFTKANQEYPNATLVFYNSPTQTACGTGSPAMGPFYCGADQSVYLELGFVDQLRTQFGAAGDFAWAYVVAHELGHHLQTITGISQQVQQAATQNPPERNRLSVRQELQADCLAGAWAFSVFYEGDASKPGGIQIDRSDIREALEAAAGVGDDRIQAQAQGRIDPEGWTHGSAEQRERWFTKGFETGDPASCEDAFNVDYSSL